jgi:hypothetical protein
MQAIGKVICLRLDVHAIGESWARGTFWFIEEKEQRGIRQSVSQWRAQVRRVEKSRGGFVASGSMPNSAR